MYYVVYFADGITHTPGYKRVASIEEALSLFRFYRAQGVRVTVHRSSDCEIIAEF